MNLDAFGEKGREAGDGIHSIPPNSVLHVNIELVSFKPVINVTGDSMVVKKILKEGEGAFTANEGADVTVSYTVMLEDGTVFEKRGIGETQPLKFITDEEQVIAGLDRAVATMKKGERAIVNIHPDYAFGNAEVRRDLAIVPPGSNVVYDIEMMDFIKEKAPWELNSNEKIEVGQRKKEEGNLLFKGGKYQRAARKYEKAADFVSEDGSFGDDEQKLAKALRVSCWLNGAACSFKLNDFPGAIKLCSQEKITVGTWISRNERSISSASGIAIQSFCSPQCKYANMILLWMPWTMLYQSSEMIMHPARMKSNPL